MKNLNERLLESLGNTFGNAEHDYVTREYNNVFGMMSNTLLRRVYTSDYPVYVITGSILRSGYDFIFTTPVTTLGKSMTPAEYFSRLHFGIYSPSGAVISGSDADAQLPEEAMFRVRDLVKDPDYLIVAPIQAE